MMAVAVVIGSGCSDEGPPAVPSAEDVVRLTDSTTRTTIDVPAEPDNVPRCMRLTGTVSGPEDASVWVALRLTSDVTLPYSLYPARRTDPGHWEVRRIFLSSPTAVGQELELLTFAIPQSLAAFMTSAVAGFAEDALHNRRFLSWGALPSGVDGTPEMWVTRSNVPNQGC